MTFAEKLTALRQKYGMTQQQVARALGVTRQAVSRWENETSLPDSVTLLQLAEEFDVEPEWLMDDGRGGEPEPRRVKRARFEMADRVCLVLLAVSVVWYAVSLVLTANGTFVRWMLDPATAGAYRAFTLVNWLVLMPWQRFLPGWLAGALVCRYIAVPDLRARRSCRRLGFAVMGIYVLTLVLAALSYTVGGEAVKWAYNFLINRPGYMLAAGALLGLARQRARLA